MSKDPSISLDYARKMFVYDPKTGEIRYGRRDDKRGWNLRYSGKIATFDRGDGYLGVTIDGRCVRAHRIIWFLVHGRWPSHLIDHKNGVKNDNRLVNLREATRSQNAMNRHAAARTNTGVVGIRYRDGGFQASYGRKYLGSFKTLEEAKAARAPFLFV